jgi:hypothetical protein
MSFVKNDLSTRRDNKTWYELARPMYRKLFFQKMSPAIVAVGVLFTAAMTSSEHLAATNKPLVLAQQAGSSEGTIG